MIALTATLYVIPALWVLTAGSTIKGAIEHLIERKGYRLYKDWVLYVGMFLIVVFWPIFMVIDVVQWVVEGDDDASN